MSAGKLGSETIAACNSSCTLCDSACRRLDFSLRSATKRLRSSASSRRPCPISAPISLAALFCAASVLSSSVWMALRRSSSVSILAMTGAASTPFLASLRIAACLSSRICFIVSMVSCVFVCIRVYKLQNYKKHANLHSCRSVFACFIKKRSFTACGSPGDIFPGSQVRICRGFC